MAHLFHGLLIKLAFLCFLWDAQHAVLFSQSLCMSSFELRTSLPCSEEAWEAESAEEWWEYAENEPQIPFLYILKAYVNSDSASRTPQLDALSHLLILHGLMSIQWDMKRRDQASLGAGSVNQARSANQWTWQERLAQSYDVWKADFDTYCMNTTLSLRDGDAAKADFVRFSTTTMAIYHAAHITLEVEILDLKIYAGARHILGRPVSRADFDRSRRVVREWAKPGKSMRAAKATWHAAHLLRDGIMNLDNWNVNHSFHYPWSLYLATLTVWAFNVANAADDSAHVTHIKSQRAVGRTAREDWHINEETLWNAKVEMNALVSNMTTVIPDHLWRVLGKHSTSGLTNVMARHLSEVRWAVEQEGVKVLEGLTP
ncbi:MAG: hypothetical protein M1820_008557 [Bogoriella megaspora]|nr:MAG: hypothetical protein M1820_008557 [Bogoriella megaspora]